MLNEDHACARCARETPVDELVLWTSRERLREYSRRGQKPGARAALRLADTKVLQGAGGGDPVETASVETAPITEAAAVRQGAGGRPGRGGAVRYRWVTVAHAVCPDCLALIERDAGRFHDPDRRRAVVTVIAVVALIAFIWVGCTMFMPNWAAAFWQNGARGP